MEISAYGSYGYGNNLYLCELN